MKPRTRKIFPVLAIALPIAALALALLFGGPSRPAPMAAINDPFKAVDFSGLPAASTFQADDGTPLAYRYYAPAGPARGSVTLVHGSSASSHSMHPMAKAFMAAGYAVYALDIRGHGASGAKGHIDHIGQLESDLAAFVRAVRPPQPSTLAGFSAGGGFVLRFAASPRQSQFGSYLLLSPFISQDAPNQKPGSGGWVSVGIPRIVALSILNAVGVQALNGLTVSSFALNDHARVLLTPEYDFNLAMNFRPQGDYAADLRNVRQPCAIVAGTEDEAFHSDRLAGMVRDAGQAWPVVLVPGLGHIPLTLEAAGLRAMVEEVGKLQQAPGIAG